MALNTDAIKAGDAIWEIGADTAELEAGLRRALDKVQSTTQRVAQRARQIGVAFTAAGGAITAGMGVAVKTAADFQQSITNAASVTGKTGEEFEAAREKMAGLARTLGETTVFSASEAADAFYDLSSKGFDVAAMSIEELEPLLSLAAATQDDLTHTTETVTSTLRGFQMENRETGRIADVFTKAIGASAANMSKLSESMKYVAPVAQAAGISLEQTTAQLAQLYNAGLDGSMAGTALRMAMTKLMDPSKELDKVLTRLGLTQKDISLQTHSVGEVFATLKERGMTASEAMSVFGQRAGPAVITLLDAQDAAQGLTLELEQAGGIAKKVADQQLDTLNGQMKLFSSALESVKITVGKFLLPALTDMATKFAEVLQWVSGFVSENEAVASVIVKVVAGIGAVMVAVGPLLILLPTLVSAVGLVGSAFAALVSPIGLVVAALAAVATYLSIKFAPQIRDVLSSVLSNWREWATHLYDVVQRFYSQQLQPVMDRLLAMVKRVWGSVMDLYAVAAEWIKANQDKILAAMEPWIEGMKALWDAFVNILETVWTAISTVLSALFKALGKEFPEIAGTFTDNAGSMGEVFKGLAEIIASVTRTITELFKAWAPTLEVVLKNTFGVLIEVVQTAADVLGYFISLAGKAISVAGSAATAISNAFVGGEEPEAHAAGGIVTNPLVRWNEEGGEIAVMPTGTRILAHQDAMRAAENAIRNSYSGSGGIEKIEVVVNEAGKYDPRTLANEIGREVMLSLERQGRTSFATQQRAI